MSNEPTKITSVDASSMLPKGRKNYDTHNMPSRPSYSPTNAQQFKAIFDQMLVDGTSREVHSSHVGLKASTLYIKANDALKWLVECDPEKGTQYAALRTMIRISRTDYGIFIYFKPSINQINRSALTSTTNKDWKQELLTWITTAQDMEVFTKQNILITPEDREWITRIAHDLGPQTELEITANGFRMMR